MERLLHKLNQYPDNLTIAELKAQLDLESRKLELEEEKIVTSVKEKVEGKYFKFNDESIFGESLEVIYVDKVVSYERTSDWDLLYKIEGTNISFESRHLFYIERESSYTEERFDSMVEITEIEYKTYYDKYLELHGILTNLSEKI